MINGRRLMEKGVKVTFDKKENLKKREMDIRWWLNCSIMK